MSSRAAKQLFRLLHQHVQFFLRLRLLVPVTAVAARVDIHGVVLPSSFGLLGCQTVNIHVFPAQHNY
jgi:hypothetical protein